jgi:hypothetical protein
MPPSLAAFNGLLARGGYCEISEIRGFSLVSLAFRLFSIAALPHRRA